MNSGPSDRDVLPEFTVQKRSVNPSKLWGAWFGFLIFLGCLAFGVYTMFSRLAVESYSADELYAKMTDGRREVRRMAAAEWSRLLVNAATESGNTSSQVQKSRPNSEQTARLGRVLSQSLSDPDNPDATYLSAIATLLGFSQNPAVAKKFLTAYLQTTREKNLIADPQIYALISLSRIGLLDEAEIDLLIEFTRSANPDLRKTAAYALGGIAAVNQKGIESLVPLLGDGVEDVRWNAAVALTRLGRTEGLPVLAKVLDEASHWRNDEVTLEKFELAVQVLRTVNESKIPALREVVEKMAASHPNLKLRQAAKSLRY